ncbi:hypothetical protein CHS0354_018878 [Potamilus streckersoni]|uniref:Uncharacterized protein n=1 Tax=Potamilus streckersoni TaxID=2493646 RepID=A0AAE0VU17_9BIVA|nr:hypothetical protein CHS0354_018878 [Potamilus streckersoni]
MLLAMSPGLTTAKYPEWNLIQVDPMTGKSRLKCPVVPSGFMENYYGGVVFGGVDEMARLYYILRVADSYADVIVSIDVNTCQRKFSPLTSLSHVHNIALVMN